MDPKIWNLLVFTLSSLAGITALLYGFSYVEKDPIRMVGWFTLLIIVWRSALSIYRRKIQPAKDPKSYGKWAIVTGSTSGIGKDFATYLAEKGMSVFVISRTESKLQEQCSELLVEGGGKISAQYLTYDFTKGYVGSTERTEFYTKLDKKLEELHNDGGIGLLVNNVGMANPAPKLLMEMPDSEVDDIINCNIMSVTGMTRAVLKFMKQRDSGAVLSISSGSGNFPASYLCIYSSTKAFMTQFSRTLTVEYWDTGIDFLVVTPFYVVSNLYKRKTGTVVAPMPIKLIEGAFCQLGKKMVWQGHGYWFHGLVGNLGLYYPDGTARQHRMMIQNRKRYDDRQAQQAKKD